MQPHLERVELPVRSLLEIPNQPIEHVFFPESGIFSVVVSCPKRREIEVGIIGREGMTGLAVVLGDGRGTSKTFVQVAGESSRIGADELRCEIEKHPSIQRCFLKYAKAMLVQTSYTALANGRANLEVRLARWLLMCLDRTDATGIPITHECVAVMLGVRRAGVTEALGAFQREGLIECARGAMCVLDRAGLEKIADGVYGVPEAELSRMLPWKENQRQWPNAYALPGTVYHHA